LQSVPIGAGKFSDVGYRFRANNFLKSDGWLPADINGNEDEVFYDYKYYNVDTFDVEEEKDVLAEIYFRLEVDQINHERVVFSLMDWLGALGGVPDILMMIAGLFVGGYAVFNSTFYTIAGLYRVRSETSLYKPSKKMDENKPKDQKIKLDLGMRCCLYIYTESTLHYICFDICKSEKLKQHLSIYDKGREKLEQDFDIRHLIKNHRELKHSVEVIKVKMKLEDDPDFEKTVEEDIIDADAVSEEGSDAENAK